MKILVCDDSLIMRNAISRNVKNGLINEVIVAENGEAALELFDQHQPQLVTMDLTMPKRNGLEAIESIMGKQPSTAILVISALNSHQIAMDAIHLGACGFLTKPFTESEVEEAVNKLVEHATKAAN